MKCGAEINSVSGYEHFDECPNVLRKCEYCLHSIKQELYAKHVETVCPDKEVQCECEMKIKRCELKSHLDNDCEETEV